MGSDHLHNQHKIAVVGIGCRFPGGVQNAQDLWDLLSEKKDVIGPIPEDRFGNLEGQVSAAREAGKIVIDAGGFLDSIDEFDADFFQLSPREASLLDPQQRLLLEVTYEAMEDAGYPTEHFHNSQTGVYIGQWTGDYEARIKRSVQDVDLYATLGGGRYAGAGRLSFVFNLRGPSMTIDTHCSSSLVAVHQACQALRTGEVDQAIAGGVNLILDPFISRAYSRSGILSDYGQCRFGDDSGKGYVRSEGCGIVLLKRLDDALNDGDHIHAVIRGSAVNNDGASNGRMTAPSEVSQQELLQRVYQNSGVEPVSVSYVEAHGTGTRAGDPVEINALDQVLGTDREDKLFVGSIKTNIGHTEAAAGIAGLIKSILVLKYRMAPASLHLNTPNQRIAWDSLGLTIQQEAVKIEGETVYAGVNSFGITGTNAHIILERFAAGVAQQPLLLPQPLMLAVSANSDQALADYKQRYADLLEGITDEQTATILAAVHRKSALDLRQVVVGSSRQDLIRLLRDEEEVNGLASGTVQDLKGKKIVFVFPGQGAQWPGMGRELYAKEEVFKASIDKLETAFSAFVDWKLTDVLFHQSEFSAIDQIQPALVAIEIALAELWMSKDVPCDAVIGHSMGEIAAAYIAGMLTLEDASAIICHRSRLMSAESGRGAMAYVQLTPAEFADRITGRTDQIGIAVNNSPKSVVASGDTDVIDALLEELTAEEIFCRKIKVDVASHSHHMDDASHQLGEALSSIEPQSGHLAMYSTVTESIVEGHELDAAYWQSNLREPVQFARTIQTALKDEVAIFVEVSPHPMLGPAIRENADASGSDVVTIGSLKRDEDDHIGFYASMGALWCDGYDLNWHQWYPEVPAYQPLPAYPWYRQRHWINEREVDTMAPVADLVDEKPEVEQLETAEDQLKAVLSHVLGRSPNSIRPGHTFKKLGVDSLMAVQLKEALEGVFPFPISVTSFWNHTTIKQYTEFLEAESGKSEAEPNESGDAGSDDLSDDDISDLLASELSDLI